MLEIKPKPPDKIMKLLSLYAVCSLIKLMNIYKKKLITKPYQRKKKK